MRKGEQMLMQIVETAVFSGAAAAAGGTLYASVAPQWRRIVSLAVGHPEMEHAPLRQLVQAERRIAVRRWSASSRPALGPMTAQPSTWRAVA